MIEKIKKRKVSVLLPWYKEGEEFFVFVQKRSENAKRAPGYFAFFGGGIEESESPEQGLVREINEELNIDISNYEYFNNYEFYGAIVNVYLMEVEKDFSEKVKISEGDFGKFIKESEYLDLKMLLQDKTILGNFFGLKKRSNPYLV